VNEKPTNARRKASHLVAQDFKVPAAPLKPTPDPIASSEFSGNGILADSASDKDHLSNAPSENLTVKSPAQKSV
jgi:hypothetical protein